MLTFGEPLRPQLEIFDVFMLDSEFKIERPKRMYRQGLNLLHHDHVDDEKENPPHKDGADLTLSTARGDRSERSSKLHSLKSGFARIFYHLVTSTHSLPPSGHQQAQAHSGCSTSSSGSASFVVSEEHDNDNLCPSTHMVDPSTNMDPLRAETFTDDEMNPRLDKEGVARESAKKKRRRVKEVSTHTFFIENSQMRLRLFARNTVRYQPFLDIIMC